MRQSNRERGRGFRPGALGDFGDRACRVRNLTRAVLSQGNENPRALSWANASPESGTASIAPHPAEPVIRLSGPGSYWGRGVYAAK
jgi:hypothetical protein